MINKTILLLIAFIIHNICNAQIDSSYISKYNEKISLKIYLQENYLSIQQIYTKDIFKNQETNYTSNTPFKIGLALTWKDLSIGGSYGFGYLKDSNRKKTRALDFQYHYYHSKFLIDAYFQRYRGFNTDNINFDTETEYIPDMNVDQYGIQGLYSVNKKKFSHKAVYTLSEKQLRPVGSFLIGGNIFYTKFKFNGNEILIKNESEQKITQFGFLAGYTYTWLIKQKWFINGSLTPGINILLNMGKENSDTKTRIQPSLLIRCSAGYYGSNWSTIFSVIANSNYLFKTKDNSVSISTVSIQISYIKRIDTIKDLLKKN